jgi:hypothetical protein
MIRAARQEQILDPVALRFQTLNLQTVDVRFGDAGLCLDEVLHVADPAQEICNSRIVVEDAHNNDEQRSQNVSKERKPDLAVCWLTFSGPDIGCRQL